MPRAGTSKAQYCFFRRFNCLPDSRSQSVVESTARRAIGGNISPRYLGAPNSTCKPHLSSRLPIHVARASRVCSVLSPKRLFNWSRESFVIRRVELAGRFDAGVLLAPVSFSVPSSPLAFDIARLFSDLPHGIRTGDRAWERADPVTRKLWVQYRVPWSYYGWCGIPLCFLTLSPRGKGKSLGSCSLALAGGLCPLKTS